MCKVAFIISVYAGDRPEWLRAAFDSMLQQTWRDGEVRIYVCVDGPISSALEGCLEAYSRHIYKLIRNETNRRLAFSLNRLIQSLEEEEFVFRMDADDLCVPERVAWQIKFMKAHPDVLVCGGSIQEFCGEPGNAGLRRTYPRTMEEMRRYIVKASPFAHPTVCFRRRFFEEVGLYNPSLPAQQDIELWFRAVAQKIPMANLPQTLLLFRVAESFSLRRDRQVGWREFRIYSKGILRLYGPHPFLIWPLMRLVARFLPGRVTELIYRRGIRKLLNQSS